MNATHSNQGSLRFFTSPFGLFRITAFFAFLLLTGGLGSEWRKLSKKSLPLKLKDTQFQLIQKTLSEKHEYVTGDSFEYYLCSEKFPELPGNFPCSFLSTDFMAGKAVSTLGGIEGGRIPVSFSEKKTGSGGVTLVLGERDRKDPNQVFVFYNLAGRVSFYKMNRVLVIFKWTGDANTLTEITSLVLNGDSMPVAGRVYKFE
ncbi:MAG: hypothetical protein K8R21_07075 [Leptospira sp.]|nr:hypothetical protein [Leptospira sp.]